jgi:hypothetical protein
MIVENKKIKNFLKDLLLVLEKHKGYFCIDNYNLSDLSLEVGIDGYYFDGDHLFLETNLVDTDTRIDSNFVKELLGGDDAIKLNNYKEILQEFEENKTTKKKWYPKLRKYCKDCENCIFYNNGKRFFIEDGTSDISNCFNSKKKHLYGTSYCCVVQAIENKLTYDTDIPQITYAKKVVEDILKKEIERIEANELNNN